MNQRTPPIRPEVWEQPAMRTALAQRDIGRVYRLLTAAGISQHSIARLAQQSQSEVSGILSGRQVKQVDVLERICDGLGAERGWMRLADDSERGAYPREEEALWEAVTEEMKRRDGLALAKKAVDGVALLRSVRARERLGPLADTLNARPGADTRELAGMARRVAASRP